MRATGPSNSPHRLEQGGERVRREEGRQDDGAEGNDGEKQRVRDGGEGGEGRTE